MSYVRFLKTSFFPIFFLAIVATSTSHIIGADATVTYSDVYINADITPDEAYRQLVAGNARYLKEDSVAARTLPRLSSEQNRFPIATVVYSSDMPTPPTILTQTSDHDLYLTRVESGVVALDDLQTIEYGLINLQTPLLVVMGHYPSRDVSALIRDYTRLENRAKAETAKIANTNVAPTGTTSAEMRRYNLVGPAVARSKEAYPDLEGYELANVVSEALVWQSLETILMKSTVAQDLIRAGRLNVIAAIADDKTGKIYWLGAHPLQEEFLKPTPENLLTEEETVILSESDLPAPLDDTTIQEYVSLYDSEPYFDDIVTEYYTEPVYYQPSWELFSRRAWTYRPWYGVWYDPFVPWPYWSPWGVPYGGSGLGMSFWDGRLTFFIGFNRHYGPPLYYDPNFRPRDPWWSSDYFVHFDHRRHDPVFDLIIGGRRHDVPPGPRPWGPVPEPRHYRPGAARPGLVIGIGGVSIGITGNHHRPGFEPGRPGGPVRPGEMIHGPDDGRVNPGVRPGDGRVNPGARPGDGRVNPGARPGDGRVNPGARPGDGRVNPGARPGDGRVNPGARPGDGRVNPGARPGDGGGNPGVRPGGGTGVPGVRPGDGTGIPGVRPDGGAGVPGVRPGDGTGIPGVRPGGGAGNPGVRPGGGSGIPGVRPDGGAGVPGARPGGGTGVPGARPGGGAGVPGARPGGGTGVPGVRPGGGIIQGPQGNRPTGSPRERSVEAEMRPDSGSIVNNFPSRNTNVASLASNSRFAEISRQESGRTAGGARNFGSSGSPTKAPSESTSGFNIHRSGFTPPASAGRIAGPSSQDAPSRPFGRASRPETADSRSPSSAVVPSAPSIRAQAPTDMRTPGGFSGPRQIGGAGPGVGAGSRSFASSSVPSARPNPAPLVDFSSSRPSRPNVSAVRPTGPSLPPVGAGARPAGPSLSPVGAGARPAGPSLPPVGAGARPAGPSLPPVGAGARPAGPHAGGGPRR